MKSVKMARSQVNMNMFFHLIRLQIVAQLFHAFKKRAASTGELILSMENWANDQTLYFDIVIFAVTTAVSQTGTQRQYSLCSVNMGA